MSRVPSARTPIQADALLVRWLRLLVMDPVALRSDVDELLDPSL